MSPRIITGLLIVVAASLSAPASAGARGEPLCSTRNAQHVLDAAHLTHDSDAQAGVPPQQERVRRLACGDLTGDGRRDLIVTVDFPGGGVEIVNWIAFRRAGSGFKPMRFNDPSSKSHYAFRDGFKQGTKGYFMVAKGLSLRVRHGAILERLRRYRASDKNDCCPSGTYMTSVWAWNGRWLTKRP